MILIFCALLFLLLRILYCLGEIWFERDWPRRTWLGLVLSLIIIVFCFSAFT